MQTPIQLTQGQARAKGTQWRLEGGGGEWTWAVRTWSQNQVGAVGGSTLEGTQVHGTVNPPNPMHSSGHTYTAPQTHNTAVSTPAHH